MTLQRDGGDPAEGTLRLSDEPPITGRLSPEIVRTLYEAHGNELLEFLIGVLRDVHVAQDVLQTSFRRVLEDGHTADNETIKGWIFQVALREALTYRRQASRQDRHLKELAIESEIDQFRGSFEDDLIKAEDLARMKQLLGQLPDQQQHVVHQRFFQEKSFATIADELGVPVNTVLTRMRLGLEKLRKWFDGK